MASEKTTESFSFTKKRSKQNLRSRREKDKSSSEDETEVFKKEKNIDFSNPLIQSTSKAFKRRRDHFEQGAEDSDDESGKLTISYKAARTMERSGPGDMGATATVEIDTDLDNDAQAIFQRSLDVKKALKGQAEDHIYRGESNYAEYIEQKDTAIANAASGFNRKGPMRAPANLRATVRWDYQPDICKDFKETGFCGFGDSCKFLHDRSDYKHGWQIERELETGTYGTEDDTRYEIHSSDEDDHLPFKCIICRESFKDPVVTKCNHYFCEKCALKRFRKSARCYACGADTKGTFKPASDLMKKLETRKDDDLPSDEEVQEGNFRPLGEEEEGDD